MTAYEQVTSFAQVDFRSIMCYTAAISRSALVIIKSELKMLVSDKDALERLNSPSNLMNRLKSITGNRSKAMNLFGIGRTETAKTNETKPAGFTNPFQANPEQNTSLVPHTNPSHNPANTDAAESESEPKVDDLVGNADVQIQLAHAHDKSLATLVSAVDMLKLKLDDIKPDKLPAVITATSKVVDQIQRQRIDASKSREDRQVHFHFYTPTQKKMEDYQVIEVG